MLKDMRAIGTIRIFAFFVAGLVLLLQFNNCGTKVNSQLLDTYSSSSTAPSDESLNPYLVSCINSSDASKTSTLLTNSVKPSSLIAGGLSIAKVNELDWQQDEDLVVTLDNECVRASNFKDPILNYLDTSKISDLLKQSIYVIKKENVKNLQLFIKHAVDSECLLLANKDVELKIASTDPYRINQPHLNSSASSSPISISATPSVIESIHTFIEDPAYSANNKIVKVAVIDSGVDSYNPDLQSVLARDTNGNIIGANTTTSPSEGYLEDSGFHGTHVAGLIAAQYNNGIGGSGVAGKYVALYPFRATNDGTTFKLSAIIAAIDLAIAHKVDIINMSFTTPDHLPEVEDAIKRASDAGITLIAAAGNGNSSGAGQVLSDTFKVYPAMYSNRINGLITVGSLDLATNGISSFSNRSSTYVNILAPGSNSTSDSRTRGIVSTIPTGYNFSSNYSLFPNLSDFEGPGIGSLLDSNSKLTYIQGTSMSAPIVAGAVANIYAMAKSHGKTLSNSTIKSWLANGSNKSTAYQSYSVNGAYLNLELLFKYAKGQIAPTTTTPSPSPSPTPPEDEGKVNGLTITTQPASKQVLVGQTIKLYIESSFVSGMTYQWYKGNAPITGARAKILTLKNIQPKDADAYKVVITAPGHEALVSDNAELTVARTYCQ